MRTSARALFVSRASLLARALVVLIALTVGPALAEPGVDLFVQASRELQAGRWEDAERTLVRVEEVRPDDPDVQALLGIARYELGRLEESVASCRAALVGGTRYEARTLYTMGIALARLDEPDEAQRAFARLLREHPDSPEADRLREGASPGDEPRFRPWLFRGFASVQHDDNPIRGTPLDNLALQEIARPDWLGQLWLSGTRRFAGARPALSGTVFRMDYRETNVLDFTFVEARVEGVVHESRRTRIVPGYGLQLSWLGSERYETRHTVDVEGTRALVARWTSTLELSAAYRDHPGSTFRDFDGSELSGTLTISLRGSPGSPLRASRLGLGLARSSARQGYLEHTDMTAEAGASLALPGHLSAGLAVEARSRDYRENDPRFDDRLREDFRWRGNLTLTRPVSRVLRIGLRVSLADNDSTIRRYDYRQATAGTLVSMSL